jgi:hypothetical protein
MAKRQGNDSPISEVLQRFIIKNNLQNGMNKIDAANAWKNVMGSGVNSYTKNILLKGTTLYVELTSAVLREELSYGKTKIIKILNEELKSEFITEIVLR